MRTVNKISLKNWTISALIFFLGVVLTLGLFDMLHDLEQKEMANEFVDAAQTHQLLFQNSIEGYLDVLDGLSRFYISTDAFDRGSFNTYVTSYLEDNPEIQALEWIPKVSQEARTRYELTAQKDGLAEFLIRERSPGGEMVSAALRTEYFPVYYLEPLKGNEAALGFDLASNDTRLAALEKARDTGQNVATARIRLVQESGQQYGFLVFKPVYRGGKDTSTVELRRINLAGFMLGVFRIGDILETSLAPISSRYSNSNVTVRDNSAPPGNQLLHILNAKGAALSFSDSTDRPQIRDKTGRLEQTVSFKVADRQWSITLDTAEPELTFNQQLSEWTVLLIGLMFTILVAIYYLSSQYNILKTQQLVDKRTEELSRSEARLKAIVDTASSGIIVIDRNGIVEDFNHGAEIIFGYNAGEVIGQNVKMLMPEPYTSAHTGYLNNYQETGNKKIIGIGREVEGMRKDGSTFPMNLSVSEARLSDRTVYAGIIDDITERVKAEAKLQEYSTKLEWTNMEVTAALTKAEEATHAKSAFLASMSHELRTPLNSIIGFANVLQKNKAQNLDDKELKYLDRLGVNATDLLNLINDILDISKIEAGELSLDETATDLGELIHETVEQMKGHGKTGETQIIIEMPDEVAPLHTDRVKLKQVLLNLLGNALKFTDQGTVTVALEVSPRDHSVSKISVRDTGIGIPADRLELIFEAFQQADSSISRKYGGTGLGLAISMRICQAMGCNLFVKSEEGVGSTFTLAFQADGE